jgi:predicted DNA-binding transcriptional regulator YafY
MDRFDRIFELNRLLQNARHPVSRRTIEERLECSRATAKRIIEDMRLYLNAPIVYDRQFNGYRYDQNEGEMYELPGLWFNASELFALLSAQQLLSNVQPGLLDQHLSPLQKRIGSLLETQHSAAGIHTRIRILRAASRPSGEYFQVVAGAVAQRRRLRLRYFSRAANQVSERDVSPQGLSHYRDTWYLEAWCHLRASLRTFALDAIESARELDAAARDIPEEQLREYTQAAYGIFSGQANAIAVLRFSAERARWVAKETWHDKQQSRLLDDGRYELQVPYGNPAELIMDILKFGPDVEVVAPSELRQAVAQRLGQALAHYTR